VIPYGRWLSVPLRWVFHEKPYDFNQISDENDDDDDDDDDLSLYLIIA